MKDGQDKDKSKQEALAEEKSKSKQEALAEEKREKRQCHASETELAEIANKLPPAELLADLADLYKIFGDSTRLSILSALRQGELCVMHLAEVLEMNPSAISHHWNISWKNASRGKNK